MAYKDFSLIVIISPPYHSTKPTGLRKEKHLQTTLYYIIRKKKNFFQRFDTISLFFLFKLKIIMYNNIIGDD